MEAERLEKSRESDLREWEDLMRHPNFGKVREVLLQRIEVLQANTRNRSKSATTLDIAIETASDMRVIHELNKVIELFESLKKQILQMKGVVT